MPGVARAAVQAKQEKSIEGLAVFHVVHFLLFAYSSARSGMKWPLFKTEFYDPCTNEKVKHMRYE